MTRTAGKDAQRARRRRYAWWCPSLVLAFHAGASVPVDVPGDAAPVTSSGAAPAAPGGAPPVDAHEPFLDPPSEPLPPAAPAPDVPVMQERAALLARRDAVQETFLRLIDEQRYEEAVRVGREAVDLTARIHGEQSIELASPLVNLATAQMHQGDLAGAEASYGAGIVLIERAEGIVSPRLVNALVGLGETYMRAGLYAQANEAYARALRINHAASGFYNVEQIRILDGLAESYLGLDKLPEANARQRIQIAIHRRRSNGDDAELVQALYKLGRWYHRTGQYPEARETYQQARRILREAGGSDTPSQVEALLGEARSYLDEGSLPTGVSTLKRALAIVDAQPEPDPLQRAEVLVALGDAYTMGRQFRAARQRYQQAWDELSGEDALLARRDEYFAEPTIIWAPLLPEAVGENGRKSARAVPRDSLTGTVLAQFTVTAEGNTVDALIIESEPPGLLDREVLRAIDASTYRPRLADGVPTASEQVQFRHQFRYPAPRAPSQASPPASDPAGGTGEPIGYPGGQDEPHGR
jgi:TonB family protein